MEEEKFVKIVFGENYYSPKDLRYNTKVGYMLSKDELNELKEIKDKLADGDINKYVINIPLKTFNSKHFFYVDGLYLINAIKAYFSDINEDFRKNEIPFFNRNAEQIVTSRVFSEIEGTLNIENVPTTHKRIKEVLKAEKLSDKNDIIIKNMWEALHFVAGMPEFNKENLYRLYNILSKDCLDEEDKLNGGYYRNDAVTVGKYEGAPWQKIEEMMDGLFEFVNDEANVKKFDDLMPHICHYYILYVHPYFDYNGRTARMVSLWISLTHNFIAAPLYMSEAINEDKGAYYEALSNTRDMNNDLTYFLGYIYETATKFSLIYKNVEEIGKELSKNGDILTSSEVVYLKKILAHNADTYFNTPQFINYINNNMSKQAALKILNQLADYGILQAKINKKKEKVFKLNPEYLTYKFN